MASKALSIGLKNHLLELYPVAAHRRQAEIEFKGDVDVEQPGVAVDESRNIADDLPEVEGHKRNVLLFHQRPHPLDDLARTTVVLDNVFKISRTSSKSAGFAFMKRWAA